MRQIDTVVVDKTGTLTQGKPTVQALSPIAGFDAAELLRLAASVETASEHPLARAIVAAARLRNLKLDAARDFELERSEEHTSELQSLMRISYAVFCLKKKKRQIQNNDKNTYQQKRIKLTGQKELTT